MSVVTFDKFVQVVNFFYSTIGIRPYDMPGAEPRSSLLRNLVFYISFVNMNLVLFCEILFVLMAFINGNNFLEASMNMSYIGFVSIAAFKCVYVLGKRRQLTHFIHEVVNIFPNTPEQQARYRIPDYLVQTRRVTLGFATLYILLICIFNFFAMLQYLIFERWLQLREVGQTLPYYMYIPWDWHNHWSYYLLFASESFAGYTSSAGQISCDLLLCVAATQLIMHYEHMARSIEEYEIQAGVRGSGKGYQQDMAFLGGIIQQHDKILRLTEMVNEVFGVPLLFNFMSSTFVLCFMGFQMSIGATFDTLFKLFMGLFCPAAQVFLICSYAQMLIDASQNISAAVYNQNWSNADVRYQKMLILVAKRAQKPAYLKATAFVSISRSSMTDIMQISYKFFALIRTMYSK